MTSSNPTTIWITDLSASGKTTLGTLLADTLTKGGRHTFLLDGDRVRTGLCADLGFSEADRSENIRRVAHLARILNDAGVTAVCCFISPKAEDRRMAREIVAPHRFLEVYLDAPLAVCEDRDPKGLYRRARSGEIASFTGVSAPYDSPAAPELVLSTHVDDPTACLQKLLQLIDGN